MDFCHRLRSGSHAPTCPGGRPICTEQLIESVYELHGSPRGYLWGLAISDLLRYSLYRLVDPLAIDISSQIQVCLGVYSTNRSHILLEYRG